MPTIKQILAETDQYIKVKQASFQGGFKRAQAMEGISDMPGAEHDSSVPSEYKNPDPEVDDGSQAPEGAFSNIEGAGKEDLTMKHVLEVDEPAETPDEEPLITDNADADPKTASVKLANNLLARIKKFETTKRAANQQLNMKLDSKMLDKLAGQKPAEGQQKPAEGQQKQAKAREVLDKLVAQKQAAAEQKGAEDALRDVLAATYNKGVSDAVEKIAQMVGMDPAMAGALPPDGSDPSAAAGQEALAAMAGAPEPTAPTEPAATPDPAAEAGGDNSDLEVPEGMAGEEVTVEDIVDALDTAVETGDIDPETAQSVLSELAAAATEGEATEDAAPAADAESGKEASVKFASAIKEAQAEIAAQNKEQKQFVQAVKEAADEIDAAELAAAADAGSAEGPGDEPTAEEVQQAVAELVEEGKIDPEAGAAILEQVCGDEAVEDSKEASVKKASVKKAAEVVKAVAQNYRNSKSEKDQFVQAVKEAADEIDAAELAAAAEANKDEGSGDEVTAEGLIQELADLVEAGEVSPEDAEDALHAIIGDAE